VIATDTPSCRRSNTHLGEVRLSPSTLYSAIKRLLEAGFIVELSERPDPSNDDERRRYYRLTMAGRKAAIEEARYSRSSSPTLVPPAWRPEKHDYRSPTRRRAGLRSGPSPVSG
jgi:DNA-binding PadR family transcriptional regulator